MMRCFIAASCFALSSILLLGPAPLSAAALDPASPPGFELHPSLEMTLFASEPQVVDPVGLSFDEFGRCYVIEMRDYPLGLGAEHRPGGTIRLLEDTDRDGRADRSVVFAEGLSFPTSILAWNGGVLVTAPPELLFLKDTDGDGRADVREVVLRGFKLGVTDSNLNGLRYGLDNRVHGANGGNGGKVFSPKNPSAAVDLRDNDFSVNPQTGQVERTFTTSGGFGLIFDEWGHRFGTYNINHIQQQIIATRYLARAVGLFPVEATTSISDHGEMARIYPIVEAVTRVNHPEQAGHFSSAGGMGFIGLRSYPDDLPGSVLVCDVVGNLVHRDVLEEDGPVFRARRAPSESTHEFFASRDHAFRPVGLEMGPDGALYLLDMQREVIEHPDYIPEKIKAKIDLRAGSDRGRIYRITPKGGLPVPRVTLGRQSASDWVKYLVHPNPWWRITAQRLLVEHHAQSSERQLRALVRDPMSGLGRLHAAWTLAGLDRLQPSDALELLRSKLPGLRENGLLLAERFNTPSDELRSALFAAADDPHPRVRFQAALTLGWLLGTNAESKASLARIWRRDFPWRWSRVAVLSAWRDHAIQLLDSLLRDSGFIGLGEASSDALRDLAYVSARQVEGEDAATLAQVLSRLASPEFSALTQEALLQGLRDGFAGNSNSLAAHEPIRVALEALAAKAPVEVRKAAWQVSRAIQLPESELLRVALIDAATLAADPAQTLAVRCAQIGLLQLAGSTFAQDALLPLLQSHESADIQRAVLGVLRYQTEPEVASGLLKRWRGLTPALRPEVINALTSRRAWQGPLLDAIEQGTIQVGELNLDLEQRRHLLRQSTPANQSRAAKFFSDEEYSNRKQLVEEWLPKIPTHGEASKGREVFLRLCAGCHQSGELGNRVGPNLSDLSHRSVEDLVSNILDPNMAVNPAFVSVSCETRDGEFLTGVMDSENAESVVLLQAQGIKRVILRNQIQKLEFTGKSLMPEGLEAVMTLQELRDVVAFLQRR